MGGTPFTLIESGGIAGKVVFGMGSGPEWAVWWVADDLQKLLFQLEGP